MTTSIGTKQKGSRNNTAIGNLDETLPATSSFSTLSTIHLDQTDWGVVGKQARGGLLKFWLQALAVAAPVEQFQNHQKLESLNAL